ncbi:glutamate synthase large subunit [Natronospira bacteriovora]|uniref:Glutamate synthase large subunit n=1 Tax=Natronospira bacteriovora TaxID=3069753 RepID=A0ABU0W778_9GAMM|nr:glutamate synthase large subunit [Natronospira sp. AB-CW4]MDQ2069773.1 glutamate synthase large subunit [Natronospira sp. AB-CW4]
MNNTLYRESFERDSCGFGLVADMQGRASADLVRVAIRALERLTHRGAVAADRKTGDGCGLLLRRPEAFLRAIAEEADLSLGEGFAVGCVFLDPHTPEAGRQALTSALEHHGLSVAGWRQVPTDPDALGKEAAKTQPRIEQCFVQRPSAMSERRFRLALIFARRRAERALAGDDFFYIPSLSPDTLSYKGLVMPEYLPILYPDLAHPDLATASVVFHQRFSTNTLPQWRLAQPFRFLAHNGEINTVAGNRAWARAREGIWLPKGEDGEAIRGWEDMAPFVKMDGSDSESLDNLLEVLIAGGMDLPLAMRVLIPPAWQNDETRPADVRAFFEMVGMHLEAWDGPAGVVLSDGRYAACALDRNGLRPARYCRTDRDIIMLASEAGVLDAAPGEITEKGRLGPGQMIAVDTAEGRLIYPDELDAEIAGRWPARQWLKDGTTWIGSLLVDEKLSAEPLEGDDLARAEKLFGLSFEERDHILRPLALNEAEAVGSMGDDTPLPMLSRRVRSLYDGFRQQFAQVTNPPIDPLRERLVMSLETRLGPELNPFEPGPHLGERVLMGSPVLSTRKFELIRALDASRWPIHEMELNGERGLGQKAAVARLADEAENAAREGAKILILSDRRIGPESLPVHALLATGAINRRLVETGLRASVNLVVETATARDPHHFACLIGYGATAVHPWLAYEVIADMVRSGELDPARRREPGRAFRRGIRKGLFKILSKMGISTIASYRGAALFEIVGLADEVVDTCFTGTTSRIGGAGFADLDADQRHLATRAWDRRALREQGGLLKWIHDGEYHAWNPGVVHALQRAVKSGEWSDWEAFQQLVNERPAMVLRDLMQPRFAPEPVPLEEVEPIEKILPRFDTAAMSLGALSPEAHEALAIAMNRIGGRSNSGEGGEDAARFRDERISKIKQVASGRFGVTAEYLVNAEVLQIKMAQGAKPGEGGQLPGHKVNQLIARLRYARPGVALISPPPHHDIYSIEDLAQLIFDLKQVNPEALVSVKLVASPGVGTIAAGVAKAYADLITIAGYDGGTGASPLTSVKYCGGPWEMGISEVQQTLRGNDLRGRIRLQADGGFKTGLDVIKAACLGAESYGFGTAPMIAMGCTYLRVCHLNNCTTGVATQDQRLRDAFRGTPDRVVNYFCFIAEEVRRWMARMGVRSLDELIGHPEYLETVTPDSDRQKGLDLSAILSDGDLPATRPRRSEQERNPPWGRGEMAEQMLADTLPSIEASAGGEFHYRIENYHRSIGARLSGEIARRHGNQGMAEHPLNIHLEGTAGQSFGVWNTGGLHMNLSGEANDYVGKGMTGGRLTIRPPEGSIIKARHSAIIGNTCLYGATGGELFAAGQAGERFAVRNSGATAVIEGCGDHGCEYMTGGVVVVLGETGLNFGAGMTGGFAYVLDEHRYFVDRYNHELIDIHRISLEYLEQHVHYLREMIERHVEYTGSEWGQEILDDFRAWIGKFWLVKPKAEDIESLLDTLSSAA